MFHQLLIPVGNSLALSCLVAALPVLVLVLLLGVFRRSAWQAALAGLIAGIVIAVGPWQMPLALVGQSLLSGATFALWPVMWIVFNGLLLYNIAVHSGRFEALRSWIISNLPNDRRVVLVVVGFCFGALIEGSAGFGCPVAITASLLILVGFGAIEALVCTLIFNTAPVAFGALGTPVTVLGAVTGLPAVKLAAMIGRQLPIMALILPFYVVALYGGWRSVRALWPVLLVAGASFGIGQFLAANFINYALTDVLSALISLIATLLFVRVWRLRPDPAHRISETRVERPGATALVPPWQGWLPWLIVSATVIVWSSVQLPAWGQRDIRWPGLHNAIAITLYDDKPYAAIWSFQPLGPGTAALFACVITALFFKLTPAAFWACVANTVRQARSAVITVILIIALGYLMNYAGLAYTLGKGAASAGHLFLLCSPFLGWLAVSLSGSDTSGNALFGNLQVAAATQLKLSPVLFAATNSSGGVMGKMISPQNIATGAAVTQMKDHEGAIFARTFLHSVALTLMLAALVFVEQYLIPGVIPSATP
jgi:lactate permease